VIIALVVVAAVGYGVGQYMAPASQVATVSSTTSAQGSTMQTFTPQVSVVRPQIVVPQNAVSTGPRISVSPSIASVGDNVTVNGAGFAPNTPLPIVWTTRQGSNLLGFKMVNKPLKNVTSGAHRAFSFTTKVRPDLGGFHFVAAGNLTTKSNGTIFIQRSATLSKTQGPQGTQIQVIMHGVGWDFDTNIAAFSYDNSYIGYACGFNSGGNVTVSIVASGAPGIHTIDVRPSVWWGASNFANQQVVEYRYPLLTPQDHPELMPSFHFTFLMTSGQSQ